MIQITLIQIDNYGPWTDTLGSDREYRLQSIQAELYSFLQREFAKRDGLVFYNRFDEMLAVTNGIGPSEHQSILELTKERFPFTVSMGVGIGRTSFEAQHIASTLLQSKGSAQSEDRRGVLVFDHATQHSETFAQIAHIDVNNVTQRFTDRVSAYETSLRIMQLYLDLMRAFLRREALLFYLGGDNFMALTNGMDAGEIKSTLMDHAHAGRGISLKCGVGVARSGRRAAELATANLDRIRKANKTRVLLMSSDLVGVD
jgi:GTP cyclohydrolase IIa